MIQDFKHRLNETNEVYLALYSRSLKIVGFFEFVDECIEGFIHNDYSKEFSYSYFLRTENKMKYVSIECSEDGLFVIEGGSVYDPSVGSDSFSDTVFEILPNGIINGEFGIENFKILKDMIRMGAQIEIEIPEDYIEIEFDEDSEIDSEEDYYDEENLEDVQVESTLSQNNEYLTFKRCLEELNRFYVSLHPQRNAAKQFFEFVHDCLENFKYSTLQNKFCYQFVKKGDGGNSGISFEFFGDSIVVDVGHSAYVPFCPSNTEDAFVPPKFMIDYTGESQGVFTASDFSVVFEMIRSGGQLVIDMYPDSFSFEASKIKNNEEYIVNIADPKEGVRDAVFMGLMPGVWKGQSYKEIWTLTRGEIDYFYKKWIDNETKELYINIMYKDGKPFLHAVKKELFERILEMCEAATGENDIE